VAHSWLGRLPLPLCLCLSVSLYLPLTSLRENIPLIQSIDCPQQINSFDCGVYVLLYALCIATLALDPSLGSLTVQLMRESLAVIVPQDCHRLRREVLTLIDDLT
jgi:Ulp1 family protease